MSTTSRRSERIELRTVTTTTTVPAAFFLRGGPLTMGMTFDLRTAVTSAMFD